MLPIQQTNLVSKNRTEYQLRSLQPTRKCTEWKRSSENTKKDWNAKKMASNFMLLIESKSARGNAVEATNRNPNKNKLCALKDAKPGDKRLLKKTYSSASSSSPNAHAIKRPVVQSDPFGRWQLLKVFSADGHALPSPQHWLPWHLLAPSGQATFSPTAHVPPGEGAGEGVGDGGVGTGLGVGVGLGDGCGDGCGDGPGESPQYHIGKASSSSTPTDVSSPSSLMMCLIVPLPLRYTESGNWKRDTKWSGTLMADSTTTG